MNSRYSKQCIEWYLSTTVVGSVTSYVLGLSERVTGILQSFTDITMTQCIKKYSLSQYETIKIKVTRALNLKHAFSDTNRSLFLPYNYFAKVIITV